jgi:hypothetical protein
LDGVDGGGDGNNLINFHWSLVDGCGGKTDPGGLSSLIYFLHGYET